MSLLFEVLYEVILEPVAQWIGKRKGETALVVFAIAACVVAAFLFGYVEF